MICGEETTNKSHVGCYNVRLGEDRLLGNFRSLTYNDGRVRDYLQMGNPKGAELFLTLLPPLPSRPPVYPCTKVHFTLSQPNIPRAGLFIEMNENGEVNVKILHRLIRVKLLMFGAR